MRYLLLIYEEPPAEPSPPEKMAAIMDEYNGYTRWLHETGQYLGGEALQPVDTATTVRVLDGSTIATDGPFAETKEHLGGFYLIEAADPAAAIEAAARLPAAKWGRIEVRPIWEIPGDATPEPASAGQSAG